MRILCLTGLTNGSEEYLSNILCRAAWLLSTFPSDQREPEAKQQSLGRYPGKIFLPGVAAHSMIIEICPCGAAASLLRRALRARGCRFAAVGQTASGKNLFFAISYCLTLQPKYFSYSAKLIPARALLGSARLSLASYAPVSAYSYSQGKPGKEGSASGHIARLAHSALHPCGCWAPRAPLSSLRL